MTEQNEGLQTPLAEEGQADPSEILEPAPNAYAAIIEQQNAQIQALIAQTQAQSAQITSLIQNGGHIAPQPTAQNAVPQPLQQPTRGRNMVSQPLGAEFPNYYDGELGKFNPASLGDGRDWTLEGLAEEIGKKD